MAAHPAGWAAPGVDIGVIVPQVRLGYDELLHKARTVEALGLHSLWMYDHLYAPMLPDQPAFEGWTLATALLAHTTTLRVGHLVLCNNFRHPALLAKMATTLDVISDGRLELGIGSGSYEPEHQEAGLPWGSFTERSERLAEALEVITAMFTGPRTTYEGRHYQVRDLPNLPAPVQRPRPPLHIGGAGERFTLPLVARHADVWNVPTYALGEFPAKRDALRARVMPSGATRRRSGSRWKPWWCSARTTGRSTRRASRRRAASPGRVGEWPRAASSGHRPRSSIACSTTWPRG